MTPELFHAIMRIKATVCDTYTRHGIWFARSDSPPNPRHYQTATGVLLVRPYKSFVAMRTPVEIARWGFDASEKLQTIPAPRVGDRVRPTLHSADYGAGYSAAARGQAAKDDASADWYEGYFTCARDMESTR